MATTRTSLVIDGEFVRHDPESGEFSDFRRTLQASGLNAVRPIYISRRTLFAPQVDALWAARFEIAHADDKSFALTLLTTVLDALERVGDARKRVVIASDDPDLGFVLAFFLDRGVEVIVAVHEGDQVPVAVRNLAVPVFRIGRETYRAHCEVIGHRMAAE